MQPPRRAIWAWAFLDWANSAFAIVVMTAFFPIFFKSHWGAELPASKSTAYLGFVNSIASTVIAVLAPLLGSIADQGNGKKRFLVGFTVLGCAATAALPLIASGDVLFAGLLYAIAAVGFGGNAMFTDALITDVAEPKHYDRVSALGYALGYVGSGGFFVLCALMVGDPARFGFDGPADAMAMSFWLTAGWWLLFTVPCLLWVHETPGAPAVGEGSLLTRGFRQFVATFAELRGNRAILYFLIGYMLYIDGVNTVIKMATDFGLSIGLGRAELVQALVVTQFVAFPSAIAFGRLGEKIGAKRGIMIGVLVYVGVCLFAMGLDTEREFFVMAVVVGLVQGGVQSLSRSFFARLIPAEKGAEYFGFYNMLGKFATILGPALMGVVALQLGNRWAIFSLVLLFGGGMAMLTRVPDARGDSRPGP